MQIDLKITIDQIFVHLRELGRSVARKRRLGIEPVIIIAKLRTMELDGPADLVQLYSLCDGTETITGEILSDINFIPGYYWMSLDESVKVYKSLVKDGRWNTAWLPVLANGGGDFYAVICDKTSPDFGGIVGFLVGENDHLVEFKSVTTLFRTIEHSFSEKAFFVANGYLEADYPKMRMIASAIQPEFAEHDA